MTEILMGIVAAVVCASMLLVSIFRVCVRDIIIIYSDFNSVILSAGF